MTINIWCLLIDRDHNPSFGEPFPQALYDDDVIHHLKGRLKSGENERDFRYQPANRIEIWKCKTLKLSPKDSLNRLKELLSNIKFSDDEDSDVEHLVAGQSVMELGIKDDELLLVLVP
ncbi:hypothetical protein BJY52DRAFT_1191181 [Lactarius psammicola]|nr:hypothetical protein BJY52DRAFT_1191181 [Lactarius psammicola]